MAFNWNIFRILADISHTLSKCILIWAIHWNRSAEGVSLITQIFYLVVFVARYCFEPLWPATDNSTFHKLWLTTLKFFYIISSAYIIFLMMRVYARTREREKAWKWGLILFGAVCALDPLVVFIDFRHLGSWSLGNIMWVFSIMLESVCVLPQLLLLRQTTVPTVLDSYYLVTLGSYRGFYVLSWIINAAKGGGVEPVEVVFGVIQTALYVDFAWVYYGRQRVKLRGGAIVDSDDFSRGWLVKRFIGPKSAAVPDADAEAPPTYNDQQQNVPRGGRRARNDQSWGPRGISVSADDTLHEEEERNPLSGDDLADPEAFEDRDSSDDERRADRPPAEVGNGSEWREETAR